MVGHWSEMRMWVELQINQYQNKHHLNHLFLSLSLSEYNKFCAVKTCPKLTVPYYGMATCKNTDLNLFFDYTPRNESFMQFYDNEELRTTALMPIDTDCKFKCGPGFYMIGSSTRNCLPLSKWDGLQTTCKRKRSHPFFSRKKKSTFFAMEKSSFCSNCRNHVFRFASSCIWPVWSKWLRESKTGARFELYANLWCGLRSEGSGGKNVRWKKVRHLVESKQIAKMRW